MHNFAEIFAADWNMSEPGEAPTDALFAAAVEGMTELADFAQGGVMLSTVRDYADV